MEWYKNQLFEEKTIKLIVFLYFWLMLCSEGDHEWPAALSADFQRVWRNLRRPADIDAVRLLNREQWRQLEWDIAEESWTNWYKHLTYNDIICV